MGGVVVLRLRGIKIYFKLGQKNLFHMIPLYLLKLFQARPKIFFSYDPLIFAKTIFQKFDPLTVAEIA
jgi:hypothetical protein